MPTTVGTVYVDVKFNVGDVARQLQQQLGAAAGGAGVGANVGAEMERSLTQSMQAIGTKMQAMGRQMSVALSLPLTLIGKASVDAFQEFDKAMTQISALNAVPIEQTEQWRGEVRALGVEYGIAAEEAAKGLYFITSSGVDAADAMGVLEVAMKGAAVGLGETKVVADVLTSAMSAYGPVAMNAAKAGDVLAAAVRYGKGEADELAGALSQVIPIAANVGVEFGEVAGAMAAMTLSGTSADQAATQLRGLFNTLQDMPPIAQRALETYTGMTYKMVQANLKSKGLVATLHEMYDAFGDNKLAVAEVFGNIRAMTGIMNMFGQNTARTLEVVEKTKKASGDLNRAWEITAQSKGKQLEQAFNRIHDAATGFGASLTPVITFLADKVGTLTQVFAGMNAPMQTFAATLGVIAAAGGPALIVLGSLLRAAATVKTAFPEAAGRVSAFTNRINEASAANDGFIARAGGIRRVLTGAVGVASALAAAYGLWAQKMGEARQQAEQLGNVVRATGERATKMSDLDTTIRTTEEGIANLKAEIMSIPAWNLLDVDYREAMKAGLSELERNNQALKERRSIAQTLAAQMGRNVDDVLTWLAAEAQNGRVYKSSAEAMDAYIKALDKGDQAATDLANSTDNAASKTKDLIDAATKTSDLFFAVTDAEKKRADAVEGVADAKQKVLDAEEAHRRAQQETLSADRKILDAQNKVTEAVQNTADARQRLVDAQKELNDAIRGEQEQLDLESARISLAEAQKRARGSFSDPLERRRAQLDVRRAQMDLERAQGAQGKRIAEAQRGVRDAQQGVTDALQGEIDARQGVVDARNARADAARNEADAFRDIADAQKGVKTAEEELFTATDNLTRKQSDLNNAIANTNLNTSYFLQYLEDLRTKYPEMAGTIDGYVGKFKELWGAAANQGGLPGSESAKGAVVDTPQGPYVVIPGLEGLFRAAGGPVSAGQMSQVNERGAPELWSAGGKQYLLPTDNGRVTPLKPLDINVDARGGDGISVGDIYVQGADDPVQTAYEVRRQLRVKTRTRART